MKSVLGFDAPLVPIPKTYDGDFFEGSYLKIENLGILQDTVYH